MSTGLQPRPQQALSPKEAKGKQLVQYLTSDAMKKRIAGALPKHMTADRVIRMALTAASKTPKLLDCTMESIGLSLLQASQLGVEINGRDAHLVPFGHDCQLIIDYKGYVQLAYRSGIVKSIKAKAVHERDFFEFSEGTDEYLRFKAYEGEGDPGELVYAWAMCKLMNGGEAWVVMNRRQIMARRAVSKNPQNWDKYPDAYWAKTAVREMAKWMPQVAELQDFHRLVETDEAIDVGSIEIEPPAPTASKAEEMASRLKAPAGNGAKPEAPAPEPELATNPPTPEEVARYAHEQQEQRERQPGEDDQEAPFDASQDPQANRIAALDACKTIGSIDQFGKAVADEVAAGICSQDEQIELLNRALGMKARIGGKGRRAPQ